MADLSFAAEVWSTLSKHDASGQTEKRGGYNYLSWSWCWTILKDHYPESKAAFSLEKFEGGTVEVACHLTVKQGEKEFTDSHWLAVMDNRHKAVKNPSATDISNTRMRCLVKTIAVVTGLGLYIYSGEDLPSASKEEQEKLDRTKAVEKLDRTKAVEEAETRVRFLLIRQRLTEQVALLGGRSNVPQGVIDLGCSDAIEDKIRAVEELDKLIEAGDQ